MKYSRHPVIQIVEALRFGNRMPTRIASLLALMSVICCDIDEWNSEEFKLLTVRLRKYDLREDKKDEQQGHPAIEIALLPQVHNRCSLVTTDSFI
jgi:hypothetical protein